MAKSSNSHPISFEDALNEISEYHVTFEQYEKQDHYGAHYLKSYSCEYDENLNDPITNIRASTIISQNQPKHLNSGKVRTSKDILHGNPHMIDDEITRMLRRNGLAEEADVKLKSKTDKKQKIPINFEMYGMEGFTIDDDYFKLTKEKRNVDRSAIDFSTKTIFPNEDFVLTNKDNSFNKLSDASNGNNSVRIEVEHHKMRVRSKKSKKPNVPPKYDNKRIDENIFKFPKQVVDSMSLVDELPTNISNKKVLNKNNKVLTKRESHGIMSKTYIHEDNSESSKVLVPDKREKGTSKNCFVDHSKQLNFPFSKESLQCQHKPFNSSTLEFYTPKHVYDKKKGLQK